MPDNGENFDPTPAGACDQTEHRDSMIFAYASKKKQTDLQTKSIGASNWTKVELLALDVLMLEKDEAGKTTGIKWNEEKVNTEYLKNESEGKKAAMQYCIDISTICGWFPPRVLSRHQNLPPIHIITAYRLRMNPNAVLARGNARCYNCKISNPPTIEHRVSVHCWHVPTSHRRCACCAARTMLDCSFETGKRSSRASVITSTSAVQGLKEHYQAFSQSVTDLMEDIPGPTVATRRVAQRRLAYEEYYNNHFGDLSVNKQND